MRSVPIGVVIVNWNGQVDTIQCLESLAAAQPRPASVVVVDNASTDGSVPALGCWAEHCKAARPTIVASDLNRGFAGGSNLGIAHLAQDAELTHFLLLNNDATVDQACFAELARALERAPDAGILGVTIYEGLTRERVWYAGGRLPRLRGLTVHGKTVPRNAELVATEFVTGCAMLIARRVWESLGPLPECYFMYFEDTEYSHRARAAGFQVAYVPRAVVHHVGSGTVRRLVSQPRNEYWFSRARAQFARRNRRGPALWRTLAYLALARPARAALELLRGRPRVAWAGLRGTIDGLLAIESQHDGGNQGAAQRSADGVVVQE